MSYILDSTMHEVITALKLRDAQREFNKRYEKELARQSKNNRR